MRYYCIFLFLMIPAIINAASLKPCRIATTAEHEAADTDTIVRKQSATVGVSYGSDVQFFGRTGPISYPFVSADAIYNTKNGFFIYTSGLKVLGYEQLFDEIDLGGGYLFKPSKNYSTAVSYSRFFFSRDKAQIINSASNNDININNSYDWKIAKSGIVLDYLFGTQSDVFITLNTSKYFETHGNIFDDKDYISFNPGISAILGTQNFVQRYALDHRNKLDAIDIYFDDPDEPRIARSNRLFKLLNYSIKIPIAYNRPHYTFEFAYKYSIPINVEGLLMNHHESFYNLTFFYVFY